MERSDVEEEREREKKKSSRPGSIFEKAENFGARGRGGGERERERDATTATQNNTKQQGTA